MNRRPPISTLLPYASLFLSISRASRSALSVCAPAALHADTSRLRRRAPVRRRHPQHILGHRRGDVDPLAGEAAELVDRKSTRLNSSHANISYAVFCLKKKTQ